MSAGRKRAFAVALSLCLALFALSAQLAKPSKAGNSFAPSFKEVGDVGEAIEMRQGTLTFTTMRVAKAVESGSSFSREKVTTGGYWLLVAYRFHAVKDKGLLSATLYSGDGAKYPASNRFGVGSISNTVTGEAGFTTSGILAFEVPESGLAGASIALGSGGLFGSPVWDSEAVIRLGIDQERAKRLVDKAPKLLRLRE